MLNEKEADTRPESEPVESPSTELTNVLSEGDPDLMLAVLEKKASLAIRFAQAINTILITQTYPEDWKQFGEGDKSIVCLSSAGAERVARHFGIKVFEVTNKKEEFTDSLGKGYRYVFEGKAAMGDRLIYAQGTYSTRDKFLGFKSDAYRAIEDINENDIRDAAYHIFNGNAIKALLGLRGIPAARFAEIMKNAGENANKSTKIQHGSGVQGGTSPEDQPKQKELGEILMEIANAGCVLMIDEQGQYGITTASEQSEPLEIAKSSCKALTSFYSKKDSKIITGIDSAKLVKGQRLEIALKNIKPMWEAYQKEQG